MADDLKVNLEENSKFRVAHQLMHAIAGAEQHNHGGNPREYYLRLYRQCYETVNGYEDIDKILEQAPSRYHPR